MHNIFYAICKVIAEGAEFRFNAVKDEMPRSEKQALIADGLYLVSLKNLAPTRPDGGWTTREQALRMATAARLVCSATGDKVTDLALSIPRPDETWDATEKLADRLRQVSGADARTVLLAEANEFALKLEAHHFWGRIRVAFEFARVNSESEYDLANHYASALDGVAKEFAEEQ